MSASAARLGHVPGAKVIAYYADADGQFSTNKIGYDVDLFDEAVRNIAFGELRKKQDPSPQADDHLNTKLRDLAVQNEQRQDGVDTVSIKKEDVQFISAQLEISNKAAEKALRRAKGNLEDALLQLVYQTDLSN
ncbi:hypothetical protein PCANC_00625 [Puccinia coronata f. sp. avenae]|uniref:Nascent polypeptide-associated complex subunit alpha-like UBA domain-containing protein n=1 Tax=Puccinia coronata f. sp. avenae TaxID=200324 RepID=A0A2N5W747_9BASI|nr:hypothetical protein PCANC_00625 [Puccinia coronata f. sp. avenae]